MTRHPLRCPTCRHDVGATVAWWPLCPPHGQPTCPGTGARGHIRRHGRWVRPLLTDTPETADA